MKQAYEEESNRTSNILLNKAAELRLRTNLLPLAQPPPAVEGHSSISARQDVSPVIKPMMTTPTSKKGQVGPRRLDFPSSSLALTVRESHGEGNSRINASAGAWQDQETRRAEEGRRGMSARVPLDRGGTAEVLPDSQRVAGGQPRHMGTGAGGHGEAIPGGRDYPGNRPEPQPARWAAHHSHLPRAELPSFLTGKQTEWAEFRRCYQAMADGQYEDPIYLHMLKTKLPKEGKNLLAGITEVQEAWQVMENFYGKTQIIIACVVEELL